MTAKLFTSPTRGSVLALTGVASGQPPEFVSLFNGKPPGFVQFRNISTAKLGAPAPKGSGAADAR